MGALPRPPISVPSSGIFSLRNDIGSCTGRKRWHGTDDPEWYGGGVASRNKRSSQFGSWHIAQRSACCRMGGSGCAPAGPTRHEQESHASVVQYKSMREPHEGAQVPGASRSPALILASLRPEICRLRDLNSQPTVYKSSGDFRHICK